MKKNVNRIVYKDNRDLKYFEWTLPEIWITSPLSCCDFVQFNSLESIYLRIFNIYVFNICFLFTKNCSELKISPKFLLPKNLLFQNWKLSFIAHLLLRNRKISKNGLMLKKRHTTKVIAINICQWYLSLSAMHL